MDRARLDDALASMTRRDLEALRAEIEARMVACTVCGKDGAVPVHVTSAKFDGGSKTTASLYLCKPCFEKHRLPEGRAFEKDLVGSGHRPPPVTT